jgi:AraC-like DNA-binding protein
LTGFLNTIILLGALQGFIVSILLFRRQNNKQPDRLLTALILLMALASINLYFLNTGWFESSNILRVISWVVPLVIVMPMGPLIYFYIRSGLDPSFQLDRKHRLQFYTAVIDIVPELAAILFIGGVYTGLLKNNPQPWGLFIDRYNMYADIPRWLSLTVYVWLSYQYIKRKKAAPAGMERKTMATLKGLQQFITIFLVFQLIWLAYLVPYIIPAYSDRLLDWAGWYPIYIPLAIMIYWLGIKGYLLAYPASPGTGKKKNTELSDYIVEETKALLKRAMETDKLYLNPATNLDRTAAHTGIPAKTISAVLNQHLDLGFTEWVNSYRINEFKQKTRNGDLERLTISAIASECGFSSQATFQRIFKQSTGMTPSEYLKKGSNQHA